MKKFVLVVMVLMVMGVGMVSAQVSDSANLLLQGTVGAFVSIDVTPAPAATALTLNVAQSTPLNVATVAVSTNTAYTISFASANAFAFSDGTTDLSYTLWVDSSPIATGDTITGSTGSFTLPVAVTFPAAPTGTTEGTYSDTVTFTITSN